MGYLRYLRRNATLSSYTVLSVRIPLPIQPALRWFLKEGPAGGSCVLWESGSVSELA
jgi:hypothetical protein